MLSYNIQLLVSVLFSRKNHFFCNQMHRDSFSNFDIGVVVPIFEPVYIDNLLNFLKTQ